MLLRFVNGSTPNLWKWLEYARAALLPSPYLRELNAAARDKTIRGILAKRQVVSAGWKAGKSAGRTGGRMDASRESASRGWRCERSRTSRRESVRGSGETCAHVTWGRWREGRSSTRTRTRNVKPARRPRSSVGASSPLQRRCISRINDSTFPLVACTRAKWEWLINWLISASNLISMINLTYQFEILGKIR